jgi:hypothetical protein
MTLCENNNRENSQLRLRYPDTSIWNCLYDQEVDPGLALSVLEARGVRPVLGYNVLYEVAKCFSSGKPDKVLRGQNLCKYLKSFMDLRIPIAMDNWALLIQEAFDVVGNTEVDRGRCYEENYAIARSAIEKLSEGNFEDGAAKSISSRKAMTRTSRDSIRDGLNAKPNTKAALLATDDAALPQFMDVHCTSAAGWQALQKHLRDLFPDDTDLELALAAWNLLRYARYRVARAITRMDIYLCWRCVHRGSIRGDVPDDAFHVTAAAYCQDFLTTEQDQAEMAKKALDGTRARVYTGNEPILQWLAAA